VENIEEERNAAKNIKKEEDKEDFNVSEAQMTDKEKFDNLYKKNVQPFVDRKLRVPLPN